MEKRNLTVLVVDDHTVIIEEFARVLKKLFKKVYTAHDGKEACEIFDRHSIDIVITDINMPIMDGTELIDVIRKKDSIMPIVIVTGYPEFKPLYKDIYNLYVLIKPCNISQILDVIDRAEESISKVDLSDSYIRLEMVRREAKKILKELKGE